MKGWYTVRAECTVTKVFCVPASSKEAAAEKVEKDPDRWFEHDDECVVEDLTSVEKR